MLYLNMKKLALLFVFVQSLVFANNPVIVLDRDNPMVLEVGTAYVDPGAIAYDEDDGDLTNQLQINGSVDTSTTGTYYISYNVSTVREILPRFRELLLLKLIHLHFKLM